MIILRSSSIIKSEATAGKMWRVERFCSERNITEHWLGTSKEYLADISEHQVPPNDQKDQ